MRQAILFKKLDNNLVRCLACPWYCQIAQGQTGICGVRQNIDGELYLLVYGLPSAVQIDPIEKKPLFHFLPGTEIFSLGTVGCNLACEFCQNWDLSQASKTIKTSLTKEKKLQKNSLNSDKSELRALNIEGLSYYDSEILRFPNRGYDLPPDQVVKFCQENHIPSIAYTYNEPSIFFEYAYDIARLAKSAQIKNVFVSNGFTSPEAIEKWQGLLDAINIDLKSFQPQFYQKVCHAKLEPVLHSIKKYFEIGVWVEITTLIIPGENDSSKELHQIADFIMSVSSSIPWHVTRFHPDYQMTEKSATPESKLLEAYQIGKSAGLKYVYVGNVLDEDHESTYCLKCGVRLIRRRWHKVDFENFTDGKCAKCQTIIEGRWE